ncbi:hypothetical protein Hypma_002533 [Hypsizygus marmoreus]|uniref:Uncharacterized protein n=1 Tax=Hypsizygus marmoreus TaxID=39966 RepID=A0A369J8E9_HYPMA|nr:hypothetical protein Hypma_002533 [Hypsizygus marmoreus]
MSIASSIFAIASGLAFRVVIDAVSHQDNRLTGTLIGLWEGVVMQHFMKKMPKSFDPYVAYGVRLFVDFLFTESLSRLVLELVWTAMGVIFADIAPAIWVDVGLRRFWRRFRRDLYIITHSIPEVALFSRPRTVRFSPSRTASATSTVPPSVITVTTQDPTTSLAPPTPASRKRAVRDAFPGDASETETDIGSILGFRSPLSTSTSPRTAHHRLTSFPRRRATVETETEGSPEVNDLDEGNLSLSNSSSSGDTPIVDPAEIPDMEEEEVEEEVDTEREVLIDKDKGREDPQWESTPKQNPMVLPPTPSDSAFAAHYARDESYEVLPPVAEVPNIPDNDYEWENISRTEAISTPPPPPLAVDEVPPTPPAEDVPHQPPTDSPLPPQVPPPKLRSISSERVLKLDTGSAPTSKKNAVDNMFNFGPLSTDAAPLPPEVESSSSQPLRRAPSPPPVQSTYNEANDLFDLMADHRLPPPSYGQDQAQLLAIIHQSPAFGLSGFSPGFDFGENVPTNNAAASAYNDPFDFGITDNIDSANANVNDEIVADTQAPADNEPQTFDPQDSGPQEPNPQPSEQVEPTSTDDAGLAGAGTAAEAEVEATADIEPAPPSPISTVSDEPLPSKSTDRLHRSVEINNEIKACREAIRELSRQRAIADGDEGAQIAAERAIKGKTKELRKLEKQKEKWFAAGLHQPPARQNTSHPN